MEIHFFTQDNILLLRYSPYSDYKLTGQGVCFQNSLFMTSVQVPSQNGKALADCLGKGLTYEMLLAELGKLMNPEEAEDILTVLMQKGVVE